MRKTLFYCLFICLYFQQIKAQNIQLQQFASGFTRVTSIDNMGDSRLFVEEQKGKIWILDSMGQKLTVPFLDIQSKVKSSGNEQGLLGLAFHPNYLTNGYFYVNYINLSGNTVVARYNVSIADTNLADVSSELILMTITQPYSNHNGGDIRFGPDGYLYIGMGDGGSAGDPGDRAQNLQNLLGKMLRIDVNNSTGTQNYGIPANNPFITSSLALPEIWAYGLRNPWRFSFDALTGDMWIGDVGQNAWEEIDFQAANSTGGENYGWRCYEGNHNYNTTNCQSMPLSSTAQPIFEYPHVTGGACSLTGGLVYRGTLYPNLYGMYLFCDYCSGEFWGTKPAAGGGWTTLELGSLAPYVYGSFGTDYKGEVYVGGNGDGKVYKLSPVCTLNATANTTNVACFGDNTGVIMVNTTGAVAPATYSWSNGATSANLSNLPAGNYDLTITDAFGCVKNLSRTIIAPAAALSVAPLVCNDTLYTQVTGGTTPYSYLWSDNSTNVNYIPTTSGTYYVAVTDANGCKSNDTISCILSHISPQSLGIQQWTIAPNPVSDKLSLQIEWATNTAGNILIFNALGQKMYENSFSPTLSTNIEIEMTTFAKGLYHVVVMTEKGNFGQKIIRE